ncbi:MAG: Flp family type IVb pilin [Alphaproteobacteria bacterium]|nr:MAG: Flp family type IVb pilin [Alphaproteobacteria bacterium]
MRLRRFRRDDAGTTILEYGLILAVASLVILAVAALIGQSTVANFLNLGQAVETAEQTAEAGAAGG